MMCAKMHILISATFSCLELEKRLMHDMCLRFFQLALIQNIKLCFYGFRKSCLSVVVVGSGAFLARSTCAEQHHRQALHQAIFSKRIVVVVVVVVGLGGVGAKLSRKGLPAVSWHWQALPKPFFPKELLLSLWFKLGLGVLGRSLLGKACPR